MEFVNVYVWLPWGDISNLSHTIDKQKHTIPKFVRYSKKKTMPREETVTIKNFFKKNKVGKFSKA